MNTEIPPENRTAEPVDLEELPTDERVLIIRGISGVFHTPTVVEGETSSTGKTIAVPKRYDRDHEGLPHDDEPVYRLDAETMFTGGLETRKATTFQLYLPETLRRQQKANFNPGPSVGTDTVRDEWDLPPATHLPARPDDE